MPAPNLAPVLRTRGFAELADTLGDPAILAAPLARVLQTMATEGQRVAREGAGPTVGRSIMSDASSSTMRVYSTLPRAQAVTIEAGRRPGAPQPPADAIASWAARRGIDPAAAFPIARAIARRGTRGRFFMRAAAGHLRRRAPELMREVVRDLGATVAHSLTRAVWRDS